MDELSSRKLIRVGLNVIIFINNLCCQYEINITNYRYIYSYFFYLYANLYEHFVEMITCTFRDDVQVVKCDVT